MVPIVYIVRVFSVWKDMQYVAWCYLCADLCSFLCQVKKIIDEFIFIVLCFLRFLWDLLWGVKGGGLGFMRVVAFAFL